MEEQLNSEIAKKLGAFDVVSCLHHACSQLQLQLQAHQRLPWPSLSCVDLL